MPPICEGERAAAVGPGRRRRGLPRVAAAGLAALLAGSAAGSPLVVEDNRLEHLSGHPGLGRGYSPQTNSLRAVCFDRVVARDPTFDFAYEVEEADADLLDRLAAGPGGRRRGALFAGFLREHLRAAPGGELRFLLARVTLDTYHHALDEAASPLSEASRKLLRDGRWVEFFTRCGFFYVRSARTVASYMALLQFRASADAAADERFLDGLEEGFLAFGATGAADRPILLELSEEAEQRDLKAFVSAIGLSTGDLAGLVPLSVDQFRKTIQQAAKLMQDPDAGVITGLEVVPWLEHPEVAVLLDEWFGTTADTFRRAQVLELNAQAIAQIDEQRRALRDLYDRARLCRSVLERDFPSTGPDAVRAPDEVRLRNQEAGAAGDRSVTLTELRRRLQVSSPEGYLEAGRTFLDGRDGAPGALACLDALYAGGIDRLEFSAVPACRRALAATPPRDRFLDAYCLPSPVDAADLGEPRAGR